MHVFQTDSLIMRSHSTPQICPAHDWTPKSSGTLTIPPSSHYPQTEHGRRPLPLDPFMLCQQPLLICSIHSTHSTHRREHAQHTAQVSYAAIWQSQLVTDRPCSQRRCCQSPTMAAG
eukprot:jgi/Ulvmu1/8484/UM044_0017.1